MQQSLYVHIPFCLKRCIYCDFVSGIYDPEKEAFYIEALKKEISDIPQKTSFATLYIGGGTPTALSAGTLTGLIKHIYKHINFMEDYEATIEANPGTIDKEKLLAARYSGINRISIGVQSFNDDELKLLGRLHSSDDAERAVLLARECGFRNIGVDLIYAVPGQEVSEWRKTLERAVSLRPKHISAYELTVEDGTLLHEYLKSPKLPPVPAKEGISGGKWRVIEEDQIIEMYEYTIDFLKEEGYSHYEISNFSMPGFACRHNLNYWDAGSYYGAGLGAHSHINRKRFHNTDNLEEYINSLSNGVKPVKGEEEITPEMAVSETLFLGLRRTDGMDLKKFNKKFGSDVMSSFRKEIAELEESGLIELYDSGSRIRLTRKGLLLSNEVFLRFM
jgi:oxygen-independent coproporphyrinogen-3 oxidase